MPPINYAHRIQDNNRFRFWVSVFTFVVTLFFLSDEPALKTFFAILLFLSYTIFYGISHLAAKNNGRFLPFLHYALISLDCIAATILIHLTGGLRSPLYFLYLVIFVVCLYDHDIVSFTYAAVLSFLLYAGLLIYRLPFDGTTPAAMSGQLLLLGGLGIGIYAILVLILRQQKYRDRLMSRAKTFSAIADVLSGGLSNSREWVRMVSKIIDDEIYDDGLQCRIIIHKGAQQFLPPSGAKVGVHIPIMVGECIFGEMAVSHDQKVALNSCDQEFFSSVARSLGLALHRAKLWDDLQAKTGEKQLTA